MDLTIAGDDAMPDDLSADTMPDIDRPSFSLYAEGSPAADRGTALLHLDGGAVLLGGVTEGVIETVEKAGGKDVLLARYDKERVLAWVKQVGSDQDDILTTVVHDAKGSLYAIGYTYGALGGTAFGNADIFVAKFDADGAPRWIRQYGSTENDLAFTGVAIGSTIYIGGSTAGKWLPGAVPQEEDGFIVEIDPDGNIIGSTLIGSARIDRVTALFIGGEKTLYATGVTSGWLHDNGAYGNFDGFLCNYDLSLSRRWTRQFGTSEADIILGGATNGTHIVLAGMTYGSFDHEINAGNYDALLLVFDLNGNRLFTRQHGNDGFDAFYGAAFLADGTVVAAGTSLGAVFTQPATGGYEIIAVRYDLYGQRLQDLQHGTSGDDGAYAVIATDGGTTLTGAIRGRNSEVPYTGTSDYFIMDIKW